MGKGGHGANGAAPHTSFVHHSDTMARPPIPNMMLEAVHDGQRLDVGILPQGVRWKHVSVTDVIRINDVYAAPDAEPVGTMDGAGTKYKDCSVYADATLTLGASTIEVLAAFFMQDKLL